MSLVITLVVSICAGVNGDAVKAKMAELKRQNPDAKITLRVDKKCLAQ